ncbi:MAG: hypothetical protein KJ048_02505 [Dehalococcoidia bacterium]|nr:hypothetical protein [Dehalococcoidia bacterium]
MMLPEVRVFLERANARRQSLLGLAAVVPEGYWPRTAPGDIWSARNHLEHVASADAFLEDMVASLVAGTETWLARTADPGDLVSARAAAMAAFAPLPFDDLVSAMGESRAALAASLALVDRTHLLAPIFVAGYVSAWGEPRPTAFSSYLDTWAAHDGAHESAIRDAVSTPPDLVAVAMARRLR